MAKFNYVLQLQIREPAELNRVISSIQNSFAGINANVKINVKSGGLSTANQQAKALNKSIIETNNSAEALAKTFAISFKRFVTFSIATRFVGAFTSGLSKAFREAVDFEYQMVRLSQVTNKNVSELRSINKEITRLSTTLGINSKKILEVSLTLAQAGFSARDTKIALDALAKTELAPTFTTIQETTEGAIAIFNQFGKGAAALKVQLGAINKVSADFAVESDDLIDAVRRAGGVFKSSGGDLNDLIAIFTSIRATTRESAESIATALKTIFARIQRPKTIEYLKELGVELVNIKGKFIGPVEAVKRLNDKFAQLEVGDPQFIRVAEELGGDRQIAKVIPLLRQYAVVVEALNSAKEGENSLDIDADKAQKSLANRITKVKEEYAALVRDIYNSPVFQYMANASLQFASALIKVADSLKNIIPLIGLFATLRIAKMSGSFIGSLGSNLKKAQGFSKGGKVPGAGNEDTVPAMLMPGEFVLNKKAVSNIGLQNLNAMNNGGKPSSKGGVQYFADGGEVQKQKQGYTTKPGAVAGFFFRPTDQHIGTKRFTLTRDYARDKKGSQQFLAAGSTFENFYLSQDDISRNNSLNEIVTGQIEDSTNDLVKSIVPKVGHMFELKPNIDFRESDLLAASKSISTDPNVTSTIAGYVNEGVIQGLTGAFREGKGSFFDFKNISQSKETQQKLSNIFGVEPSRLANLELADSKPDTTSKNINSIFEKSINEIALNTESAKKAFIPINRLYSSKKGKLYHVASGDTIDKSTIANVHTFDSGLKTEKFAGDLAKQIDLTKLDQQRVLNNPVLVNQILEKLNSSGIPSKWTITGQKTKAATYSGLSFSDLKVLLTGSGKSVALTKLTDEKKRELVEKLSPLFLNSGGSVPGVGNTDTVPAMLTPGEYVLNKKAVKNIGLSNLEKLNGSSSPSSSNGVQHFAAGGVVKKGGLFGGDTTKTLLSLGGAAAIASQMLMQMVDSSSTTGKIFSTLSNSIVQFGVSFGLFKIGIERARVALQEFGKRKAVRDSKLNPERADKLRQKELSDRTLAAQMQAKSDEVEGDFSANLITSNKYGNLENYKKAKQTKQAYRQAQQAGDTMGEQIYKDLYMKNLEDLKAEAKGSNTPENIDKVNSRADIAGQRAKKIEEDIDKNRGASQAQQENIALEKKYNATLSRKTKIAQVSAKAEQEALAYQKTQLAQDKQLATQNSQAGKDARKRLAEQKRRVTFVKKYQGVDQNLQETLDTTSARMNENKQIIYNKSFKGRLNNLGGKLKSTFAGPMAGATIGAAGQFLGSGLDTFSEYSKEKATTALESGDYEGYRSRMNKSMAADVGSSTLKYAGIGAAAGSVVPILGTAVGAAAGALVGFTTSVISAKESIKQMNKEIFSASIENMKAGVSNLDSKVINFDQFMSQIGNDVKEGNKARKDVFSDTVGVETTEQRFGNGNKDYTVRLDSNERYSRALGRANKEQLKGERENFSNQFSSLSSNAIQAANNKDLTTDQKKKILSQAKETLDLEQKNVVQQEASLQKEIANNKELGTHLKNKKDILNAQIAQVKVMEAQLALSKELSIYDAIRLKITSAFNKGSFLAKQAQGQYETGSSVQEKMTQDVEFAMNNVGGSKEAINSVNRAVSEQISMLGGNKDAEEYLKKAQSEMTSMFKSVESLRSGGWDFDQQLNSLESVQAEIAKSFGGTEAANQLAKTFNPGEGFQKLLPEEKSNLVSQFFESANVKEFQEKEIFGPILSSGKNLAEEYKRQADLIKKVNSAYTEQLALTKQATDLRREGSEYTAAASGKTLSPKDLLKFEIEKAQKETQRVLSTFTPKGEIKQNVNFDGSFASIQNATKTFSSAYNRNQSLVKSGNLTTNEKANIDGQNARMEAVVNTYIDLNRKQVETIKANIEIMQKKNELEKSSIKDLMAGDFMSFLKKQRAQGAQSAIASGDQRLMNAFGAEALGMAVQNAEELKALGAKDINGLDINKFIKSGTQSALGLRGIKDPALAAAYAGESPELVKERNKLNEAGKTSNELAKFLDSIATQKFAEPMYIFAQTVEMFVKGVSQISGGVANVNQVNASQIGGNVAKPAQPQINNVTEKDLKMINTFNNSVKDLSTAVEKLAQSKINVQLAPARVSVDITAPAILSQLTDSVADAVYTKIADQIKQDLVRGRV
jgi:TP901 family phage tail tape measure protein